MASEGPKVKASVETMAYYDMILTEAICQLLGRKKGFDGSGEAMPKPVSTYT